MKNIPVILLLSLLFSCTSNSSKKNKIEIDEAFEKQLNELEKSGEWKTKNSISDELQCPCCDYFTLSERANYDICPICFWEDDGLAIDQLDVPSAPNSGLTLREARNNFIKFGACEKAMIENVVSVSEKANFKKEIRNFNSKKSDTVIIYWDKNLDTLTERKTIRISNDKYDLIIKSYSLNNSSITRINTLNKPSIYKDIYHDYQSDIFLMYKDQLVLSKPINKHTFKDSLSGEFLEQSILKEISFTSVRSNRLYFNAILYIPDTDWMVSSDFAIFYQTSKKGKVDFWNVIDL